jgi:hypothetical protein
MYDEAGFDEGGFDRNGVFYRDVETEWQGAVDPISSTTARKDILHDILSNIPRFSEVPVVAP